MLKFGKVELYEIQCVTNLLHAIVIYLRKLLEIVVSLKKIIKTFCKPVPFALSTDVPKAPKHLRVSQILHDSVTLSWSEPETDGGAPITQYVIERKDASRQHWTTAGTVDGDRTSFRVTKLLEGNEYFLRVSAENAIGVGAAIQTDMAVEIKTPYSESQQV